MGASGLARPPARLLLILLTGLQRRPWAIWVNPAQTVLVAPGFFAVYPRVGFIGAVRRVVGPDRVFACRGAAASGLLRRNDRLWAYILRHLVLGTVTERTLVLTGRMASKGS